MVDRYDAVLAVIPVLALSGIVGEAVLWYLEASYGVGAVAAQLPLRTGGLVAALAVIGAALRSVPAVEE